MATSIPLGGGLLRTTRLALLVVTLTLIVGAIGLSRMILVRQDDPVVAARSQLIWVITQASVDTARLEAAIGYDAITRTLASRAQVGLWLDLVAHRSTLLHEGDTWVFVKPSAEMVSIVDQFAETIRSAEPLMSSLDLPSGHERLMRPFLRINRSVARLSSLAYDLNTELKLREAAALSQLHWLFSGVLCMLIVSSLVMLWLLNADNRYLKSASISMAQLVSKLRHSESELKDVNVALVLRDRELHDSNTHLEAALTNMSQALCMVNACGELIVCNARFREMFRLDDHAVYPGQEFSDVNAAIERAGSFSGSSFSLFCGEQAALLRSNRSGSFSHEDINGRALSVVVQVMPDLGWVATIEEITERRRAEARISYLAHHDALTGLPNRIAFRERLNLLVARLRGGGPGFSVLCLDLDHFKAVNDTLGHPAGDRLLELVADRLGNCLREDDLIARLGGDEFAILQYSDDLTQAAALAERIINILGEPYDLYGQRVAISVSIGISVSAHDLTNSDEVFRQADTALYDAKSRGRACFSHFDQAMSVKLQIRRETELDLRLALSAGQLEVHYQPIVDVDTSHHLGFEALLRWRHPRRGIISPGEFIPIAEDLLIIGELGRWVLETACLDAKKWPSPLRVSVNLSPLQFKDNDVALVVARALKLSGLAADRLELEVTESVLLLESDAVVATLHEIRGTGVHITLDDFGTGYASLSYLRSFPFEKVKIDQSFVHLIDSRPDCRTIVNAISSLARELGMRTTAEGVETEAQLDQVRNAGCNEVQGYFYGRPMPAVEVASYLAAVTAGNVTAMHAA